MVGSNANPPYNIFQKFEKPEIPVGKAAGELLKKIMVIPSFQNQIFTIVSAVIEMIETARLKRFYH
jgi:hypothetical protein